MCAAKAPVDAVDDLEAAVYERFVKAVYLQREPMINPAGLLIVMTQRVIASHYARGPHTTTTLDGIPEPRRHGWTPGRPRRRARWSRQLLDKLSPKQREVVWMRLSDELSSAEIAERLDTLPGQRRCDLLPGDGKASRSGLSSE